MKESGPGSGQAHRIHSGQSVREREGEDEVVFVDQLLGACGGKDFGKRPRAFDGLR